AAYSAPTTLPALVPATTSGLMPLASSILITPMWAKPLAAPPPSAKPIFGGGTTGSGSAGCGGGSGRVPPVQAASRTASSAQAEERDAERNGRSDLTGLRTTAPPVAAG